MGRNAKYNEKELLSAVIVYADKYPAKKIKATDLAEWANENILELRGVQAYHFTRPVKIINKKTGKTELCEKECKIRMDEINKLRVLYPHVEGNLIFSSASIDQFWDLGSYKQREYLQSAREQYFQLKKDIVRQQNEIEALRNELKHLYNLTEDLVVLREEIRRETAKISSQVSYIFKVTDEETRKHILDKSGISELDLKKYNAYMREKEGQLLSMQNLVNHYFEVTEYASLADISDEKEHNVENSDVNETKKEDIQSNIDNLISIFIAKQD